MGSSSAGRGYWAGVLSMWAEGFAFQTGIGQAYEDLSEKRS